MAGIETQQETEQHYLLKQELVALDITKLTQQSMEVISRQAINNIGTIGHVAHEESAEPYTISSIHPFRVKDELDSNINIKLDKPDDELMMDDQKSNEELDPVNNDLLTALEPNNNINKTIPMGIEDFLPVVKLEKITKKQIYYLTKHRDRQQNLKTFIRQKRNEKLLSRDSSRYKKSRQHVNDIQAKSQAIIQFLDYKSDSNFYHLKSPREFEFYKPTRRRYSEIISRYSTDRSETSSISGSSVSNESFRPRRSLCSPKRFKFEEFGNKEPKSRRKLTDLSASYTVEKICGINIANSDILFLVKWENYPSHSNTWEPMSNIRDCEELALEFVNAELDSLQEDYQKVIQDYLNEQQDVIESYKNKPKSEIMQDIANKFDAFEFHCSQLLYMYILNQPGYYLNFRKRFRELVILNHFLELDKQQKIAHDAISADIMDKERNEFPIYIENNVDFTVFEPFSYTRENILPMNVRSTVDQQKSGCKCYKSCSRTTKCCPKIMNGNFAYNEYVDGNRLRLYNSQMIYECNDYCSCNKNCLNRLTQQPRKIPFTIFLTKNGRGWGLKAVKSIPRGSYIIEYTGEIIDQEESVRRGEKYDAIGKSYLFDLDFNEKREAVYTIDAAHYGNLARLINHSCEPNCRIWPVTTCNHDASIYRMCIFSIRKIKAGEELTIDYSGGTIISDYSSDEDEKVENGEFVDVTHAVNNISHTHRTLDVCKCGSKFCKGTIFA
ncbi:histone-lysine N-methyltransferase SUV39H1 [Chironomus tepperi]|uniref:histone-lysine N-methyltransferase SUV39H1 n=1 Tax=Chironomus tepperi TaxID=113505 RepID=UPI00391F0F7C